jgi:Transposase DDE domain
MSVVKRLRRSVQKILPRMLRDSTAAELASDVVVGICKSQSVLLSEIGRALNEARPLIATERDLSEALGAEESTLDMFPESWLRHLAPVVRRMPFIAVDGSEVTKPYGRAFEYLDLVRDASAPGEPIKPGYWTIQVSATDGKHQNVPILFDLFSTKDPAYEGWGETFQRAVGRAAAVAGKEATWLFDRGFDDVDFMAFLDTLKLTWVIRMKRNRDVLVGDPTALQRINIGTFADGLNKTHKVEIEYVDKKSHKMMSMPLLFNCVPVKLPKLDRQLWLVVVTGTSGDDWLLLTNKMPRSIRKAGTVVRAYTHRWSSEEVTRFWKQSTGAENVRVRSLAAIRRLLFLSMMATGIQALWLLKRPSSVRSLIERAKSFIAEVPFMNYRLWQGVAHALAHGS